MDSAATLASYVKERNLPIKVFGIPKTIDNDLTGCDHTPGFGTAAKFVANSTIAIALMISPTKKEESISLRRWVEIRGLLPLVPFLPL